MRTFGRVLYLQDYKTRYQSVYVKAFSILYTVHCGDLTIAMCDLLFPEEKLSKRGGAWLDAVHLIALPQAVHPESELRLDCYKHKTKLECPLWWAVQGTVCTLCSGTDHGDVTNFWQTETPECHLTQSGKFCAIVRL